MKTCHITLKPVSNNSLDNVQSSLIPAGNSTNMGGCLPVHRAGARAVLMAPAVEWLAAMALTLPVSIGRVGAAVLQPTLNLNALSSSRPYR